MKKCTFCGKELGDNCYVSTEKNKTFYFCDIIEYLECKRQITDKRNLVRLFNDMISTKSRIKCLHTEISEWSKIPDAFNAIEYNRNNIIDILTNKGFDNYSNAFQLCRYMIAVINNNLDNWIAEYRSALALAEYRESKPTRFEQLKTLPRVNKRKRKSLDDYDDEDGED